jgi:acyl-CoA thioesterase-1
MFALIKKILFLSILCIVTLPAFAENNILVLGDSLGASYGVPTEQGWVALMQARIKENKLQYTIINASIVGDTTRNGLDRLPSLLNKHHPDIVLIELGGNDGLRGTPIVTIRKNLSDMIKMIRNQKAKPVLIGIRIPPNLGPDYTNAFQNMFSDLAKQMQVALVPSLLNGLETDDKNFQADRIHPVASAQAQMMENVWVVAKPLLN